MSVGLLPRKNPPGFGAASLFVLPALLAVALFTLYPLLEVVRLAFYRWDGYGTQTFIGLGNIRFLASNDVTRIAFEHSLLWLLAAAVIPTAAGLALALLTRRAGAGSIWLGVIFFPVLMPPTAVAAIWLLVLSPTSGPVNQLLGDAGLHQFSTAPLGDPRQALTALFVAWVWSTVGVGMLLFWSGLRGIGVEFYQMAKVEGAGSWWRMVHVTLPALRRVAAVVALVNVVLAGQVFDLIYVTTGGGPGYATLILPLDMYARAFGGKTGQGSAVALAQILLIAIMVALILSLSRDHEPFGTGEPPASRRPSISTTSTAAVAAFLSLLPLLWLLRALALPGRALALGNASPTMSAVSDNVRSAWDAGMSSALPRSLLLAVAVVAGTLTIAVPAAYSLSSLIRKGSLRVIVLAVLTLCLIQPAPVLVIPLFSLLRNLNLLDNPLGIVLPEIARAIPFAILAIWAGISGLAREQLLAARADGATSWQSMWLVVLPLAAPAVWVAAAWAFLTSWNEYLLPTVVSQDGSLATVPTTLGSFAGAYDTQFGVLAAGTAIALAPIMLLYLVVSAPAGRAAIALRGRLR